MLASLLDLRFFPPPFVIQIRSLLAINGRQGLCTPIRESTQENNEKTAESKGKTAVSGWIGSHGGRGRKRVKCEKLYVGKGARLCGYGFPKKAEAGLTTGP
jgi:hypothetical protein